MKTVEVSESALESLKAMVVQLQSERDELLNALQFVMTAHGEQLETAFEQAQSIIAKCTAKPEVLE